MESSNIMSDLEANKRDHRIPITDISISKVPLVRYREIPEEHYAILQELAKMVLVLSRENNNCNETAITYSLDSPELILEGQNCLTVSYGDEHSVDPLSDTLSNHLVMTAEGCVIIILHNHPSLSKISLQDVSYLFRFAAIKMIVAVTNAGSVNYIVKANTYHRKEALKLYIEAIEMYNKASNLKQKQDATNYFLNHCFKCGIVFETQ